MVVFPPITVRQPRPHDIVDDPVGVCGVGTGFEGVISARGANNGRELREVPVRAGVPASGGTSQVTIDLPGRPPHGARHARGLRGGPDGSGRELNKVVVPIVFGRALIDPYNGFAQYTVEPGTRSRASRSGFSEMPTGAVRSSRRTATRSRTPTLSSRGRSCVCRSSNGSTKVHPEFIALFSNGLMKME